MAAKKVSKKKSTKKTKPAAGSRNSKTTRKSDKSDRPRRISGLDLAADILAKSEDPLNAKTIAHRAIVAGWKTNGKTPHATLYAAIIREIDLKGSASRFKKTDRGLFTHV